MAVAPLYFLLRNEVVPRTNALADQLKQTEIKADYYERLAESKKTAMWHHVGSQVLEAARFDLESGDAVDLTIYDLGEDGLPVSPRRRGAPRATSAAASGACSTRRGSSCRASTSCACPRAPTPSSATSSRASSTRCTSRSASSRTRSRWWRPRDTTRTALRVDYHVKLSEAFACIVLPFSVLLFAVIGPPFAGSRADAARERRSSWWRTCCMTGVATSLGYSGALPPAVAGWLPTGVFAGVVALLGCAALEADVIRALAGLALALAARERGARARSWSRSRSRAATAAQRSIGGPDAIGGVGDWWLANDVVEVVIDDVAREFGISTHGGTIVDFGLRDRTGEDQFARLSPLVNLSQRVVVGYDAIRAEVDPQGGFARIAVDEPGPARAAARIALGARARSARARPAGGVGGARGDGVRGAAGRAVRAHRHRAHQHGRRARARVRVRRRLDARRARRPRLPRRRRGARARARLRAPAT